MLDFVLILLTSISYLHFDDAHKSFATSLLIISEILFVVKKKITKNHKLFKLNLDFVFVLITSIVSKFKSTTWYGSYRRAYSLSFAFELLNFTMNSYTKSSFMSHLMHSGMGWLSIRTIWNVFRINYVCVWNNIIAGFYFYFIKSSKLCMERLPFICRESLNNENLDT